MALVDIPGVGLWAPMPPIQQNAAPGFSTATLIDATGEKAAFSGRVFTKDDGSKTIDKIHFRFGAVTKAGGSALTVSLQDPISSASIMIPDETQDHFRAIANADASFASNTWYTTGLITSDGTNTGTKRSVNPGDPLCIVIEFDGAGRLGADSVVIAAHNPAFGSEHGLMTALKTSGSWASQTLTPNVLLEFSDGTFGTLDGAFPCSAINTHNFKQDTGTADEFALEFQIPFPAKLDAAAFMCVLLANTADFDVVLYDGTSAMTSGTVSFPGEYAASASTRKAMVTFPAKITLTANHTYRLGIKPTQTTTNVTIYSIDVASANHFQAHAFGTSWVYTTRLDLGSWAAATATRRPLIYLRFSAFDNGATVGGLLTHPGMAGGMRG